MKSIFKTIKKKGSLRRLSVLWLFLIAIEFLCPVFCDGQTSAAEIDGTQSRTIVSVERKDISAETYISTCSHQDRNHEQTSCNDECLCHATAIPNLGIITHKESTVHSEPIAFNFTGPILGSLPPPDLPPKLS